MERRLTDDEIKEILIARKIEEQVEAESKPFNEWCKAFMLVGFAFVSIIAII